MKPVRCPACGLRYATTYEEDVRVGRPPSWWPPHWVWSQQELGRVTRDYCTQCGWERETWE